MEEPAIEQYFINEQSEFYEYLVETHAFQSKQTYKDYISRLRYVSRFFRLDKTITEEDVKDIISDLTETMKDRDHYNSKKGIGDIASGLRKFLEYVQSDFRKRIVDSVIEEEKRITSANNIGETEKEELIKSRIGQGSFRNNLITFWKGCSVTECSTSSLLLASHIRPWRKSDNQQRLDVYNGLLLIPNLDKLFDRGYISFNDDGKIILSTYLPDKEYRLLGVVPTMRIKHINEQHKPYLKYHRENCLL